MDVDKTKCKHCGSENRCFTEQTIIPTSGDEATSHMCVNCGYTTTSLNKEGSDIVEQYEESTAQLIRDLRFIDDDKLVWYPIVLNFPSVGIVFPDGANASEWNWIAAKAVDVLDDEKEKYPVPGSDGEFYKRRIDMENRQEFASNDFYSACKSVGFILNEELA